VIARNVKGFSPASSSITIIAATMPPTMVPPTVTTIVPNGQYSSITITWQTPTETGGSPITSYYVQRNSGYGTAFIEPGTLITDAAATSHTFTGLVEGAYYNFRIAAVNTIFTTNRFLPDDVLNFSDGTSHIVALAPDQVTVFAQKPYDYEKGKVKMQWTAPDMHGSPVKYYTLLRDVGSGVFYPLYQGTETSFTDENLIEGQSYNYKVYATNAAGDGPMSLPIVTYAGEYPGIIRQDQVRITQQSLTALSIEYDEPENTGGLPILKYWIKVYNGDELDVEVDTIDNGLSMTYTYAVTQPGNEGKRFRFKVAS
jgi:Fibronectin type III domain